MNGWGCADCGIDTAEIHEYYMVRDEFWPLAHDGGQLCIGCLEHRLGRKLVANDFTDPPVNTREWTERPLTSGDYPDTNRHAAPQRRC